MTYRPINKFISQQMQRSRFLEGKPLLDGLPGVEEPETGVRPHMSVRLGLLSRRCGSPASAPCNCAAQSNKDPHGVVALSHSHYWHIASGVPATWIKKRQISPHTAVILQPVMSPLALYLGVQQQYWFVRIVKEEITLVCRQQQTLSQRRRWGFKRPVLPLRRKRPPRRVLVDTTRLVQFPGRALR